MNTSQWDNDKCKWGTPSNFDNKAAEQALNQTDFTKSVFVNTSKKEGKTRQAYAYHHFGGYRICVVGHIHIVNNKAQPGNSFIPGYKNWQMKTPESAVKVIDELKDSGTFPGDDRYPHPIK